MKGVKNPRYYHLTQYLDLLANYRGYLEKVKVDWVMWKDIDLATVDSIIFFSNEKHLQ